MGRQCRWRAARGDARQQGGEFFAEGTLPPREAAAAAANAAFGIRRPRDGSIVVLDPDIPLAQQRLHIEGAAGRWWLNGRRLGQGTSLNWPLQPGRHRLERRDFDGGDRADRVEFEVRLSRPGRG